MIMTKEQSAELQKAAQPLMDFLSSVDFSPHIQVVVTSTDAEVFESLVKVNNESD